VDEIVFTPTLVLSPQGGRDRKSIVFPSRGSRLGWGNTLLKGGWKLGWEILTFKGGNKIIILCSMGRKL